MGDATSGVADIAYVGFVLGHGGDALQMLDLARGVRDRGAKVRLIVPALETSRAFAERCQELELPCVRSPLITASMEGDRQHPTRVGRLLSSLHEPVVHFHTGNSCLPRSVMLTLLVQRFRPTFATLQSPYETFDAHGVQARTWVALARRRLAAVVSPSDHGARFQLRCGMPEDLVATIRNSIDVDRMRTGDGSGPRARLGVGDDVPLVVFTSRLDRQKRPVEAVRIFAGVTDEHPTARLVFVGTGQFHRAVVEEASRLGVADRVDLVGYQTNIPDWLAAATVWFLPTERENFSVAVLEAMAAGCAVLSTTCPGNDEVLVDGVNARTFGVGDVSAAQAALGQLLSDPDQRRRLGAEAARVAAGYSADRMVEEYRRLYRRSPLASPSLWDRPRDERAAVSSS